MNPDQFHLRAPWNEVRERIKEQNVDLTDEDLVYEPGKENELLQRLERKLKKPKEEIKLWIESLSSNDDRAG